MITEQRTGVEPNFTPWDREAPQWAGLGADFQIDVDKITGGQITAVSRKIDEAKRALQIATIASLVAAGAAVLMLLGERR
jgi:hypothetical protein